MTAAQKAAKANFKKAIEYRKKTGVSLKEAFAHVYGKKVGAAPKKKAAKKSAPKKAAKKVVKKAAPKKIGYSKLRLKQEKGITNVLRSTPKTKFYTEEEKIIKAGKRYFDKKDRELIAKGVYGIKKKAAKKVVKKAASKRSVSLHKDTKSHNVNIRVVSGIGAFDKHIFSKLENVSKEIDQRENVIKSVVSRKIDLVSKNGLSWYKKFLKEAKGYVAELKKHKAELKKFI